MLLLLGVGDMWELLGQLLIQCLKLSRLPRIGLMVLAFGRFASRFCGIFGMNEMLIFFRVSCLSIARWKVLYIKELALIAYRVKPASRSPLLSLFLSRCPLLSCLSKLL